MRSMLTATLLFAAGCSTLPSRHWPRHEQRCVVCTYPSDDGPIEVPGSRPELTVLELEVEPPVRREFFVAGRRFLEPDPSHPHLVLRCRYRAYATGGDEPPCPEVLFPGARSIRELPDLTLRP